MKIRLIQPPLVQPLYRQLTLPVVGAELAAQGLQVETSDENLGPLDLSDVDLVGITCHVYNAPRAFAVAQQFRERGIPVIFGGTFPTVAPALVAPHCDSVVVGELEGQAAQLAEDARAGRLKPMYRAAQPPSLAHTVKPDLSRVPWDRYLRFNFPLELSRGCRFNCRFCTAQALFPGPRTRALEDIERDLSQYDHGLVELVDVNFLNDARFFEQARAVLRQAPVPGWTGQTTLADLVADPSLPERLAESRCRAVFVGLESLSRDALRSVDKGWCKPAAFLDAAKRLNEAGVLVQAGIIVGLDGEEPGALERTAELLLEARVQTASITYLHYYPGTAPYEELRAQGRLLSTDWSDFDGNRPVIQPQGESAEQLQRRVADFLRRFYGYPSIAKRASHAGMSKAPSQLVHHLMVNLAMSAYYQQLEREWKGGGRARYQGPPPPQARWEKWGADLSVAFLDSLFGS